MTIKPAFTNVIPDVLFAIRQFNRHPELALTSVVVLALRANAALQAVGAELTAQYPAYYPAKDGWHFTLRHIADEQTEAIRR